MTEYSQSDYTKHYIVEALFRLMETKPFSEITVTELTRKAGVGRVTFYRNFKDKESVIIYFFDRHKTRFGLQRSVAPRNDADYYDKIRDVMNTLRTYKHTLRLILSSHLEYLYLDYLNENFARDFRENYDAASLTPYAYSGALFNVSMQWLKTDCAEPSECVADALFTEMFGKERLSALKARSK